VDKLKSSLHIFDFNRLVYMSSMAGVLYEVGSTYPSCIPMFNPGFLVGFVLPIALCCMCCPIMCLYVLSSVL
jgi:hypothetical protein